MEMVLDITCPTDVSINDEYEYGAGDLALGNHVQWIDAEDVTKCELVHHHQDADITAPFTIDSKLSYMEIENYNEGHNDNTYQINDYLLVHRDEKDLLRDLGCWSQVYKIVDIKVTDEAKSSAQLFLSIPTSPSEYIMRADISGQHPLFSVRHQKPTTEKTSTSRRLFTELVGNGIETLFGSNKTQGSYSYAKSGVLATKTITTPFSWEIVITGEGSINASLDYEFDIDIDLNFSMNYNVLGNDIKMLYTLNSDYSMSVDFNLEFEGILTVAINDLIKFGRYFVLWFGLVPLVIKPFIDVDLKLTTLPITVDAGLQCYYGGYDQNGYLYDYQDTYTPAYGIIKANAAYDFLTGTVKTWTGVSSISDCAVLNYEYDNLGTACKYFDYNPTTSTCKCAGPGPVLGATESATGTTAYVLDETCGSITTIDCGSKVTKCGLDITVADLGDDDCTKILGQSADSTYQCISCSDASGEDSITEIENEIQDRTPSPLNGCTYNYTVESNGYDLTTCPRSDGNDLFGFDTELTITIGANLYTIIIVYGKAVIDIPFRINVPEFDDDVCSGVSNSCGDTEYMTASFDIMMSLAFYLGIDVDFSTLESIVTDMANAGVGAPAPEISGLDFEEPSYETLIGTYEILGKTNLGCLAFDGILDFLDTYYKGLCCEVDDETGETVPVFIDLDDNGYDDRNEPTPSPTDPVGGSGANVYGLSVFGIVIGIIGVMMNIE